MAIREKIVATVRNNQDILAWCHADMTRINPNVACHALNIDPSATPVRQKRRQLDPVRAEAVKADVNRLSPGIVLSRVVGQPGSGPKT